MTDRLKEFALDERLNFYERVCKIFGKLKLPVPRSIREKYKESITFSHLRITPEEAFSVAIFLPLTLSLLIFLITYLFGTFSYAVLFLVIVVFGLSFYYLYNYPFHYAKIFKVKASSEMILAITYMAVSMKISPNLENAVKFAAKNLKGPLAKDLRGVIWKAYTAKGCSFNSSYDELIRKWKPENSEFAEALDLIRASTTQSFEKAEKTLDEAVNLIIRGTSEKMKKYVLELNTPITLINALGILLPILSMVFLPIVSIFMPGSLHPVTLILIYNILLPSFVYFFAMNYLERIPYSFSASKVENHPLVRKVKKWEIAIPVAAMLPLMVFSLYKIQTIEEKFSFSLLIYSTLFVTSLLLGLFLYNFLYYYFRWRIREEMKNMEREFSAVLFRLGQKVSSGLPLELAIEEIAYKSKQLSISNFFRKIIDNIKNLGMTLEKAIFDEKVGAIKDYPSELIENIMRAIVEISKKGTFLGARAMMIVSKYLKNLEDIDLTLRETTAETTSSLELQGMILAPLVVGLVVSSSATILKLLITLGEAVNKVLSEISSSYGIMGGVGSTMIFSFGEISKIMPFSIFEMIVGVYLIEIVVIIGYFVSFIKSGDDKVVRSYTIAKFLLVSLFLFPLTSIGVFKVLDSIIKLEGIVP